MPNAVPNLRAFLELLRRDRQLVTVDALVDPDQEIAEIHRRAIAANGPALLFTNVKGSRYSVVTNLFGSGERTIRAFGNRPLAFMKELAELAHEALPPKPATFWNHRGLLAQGLKVGLRTVRQAPVCEVSERPKLSEVPLLKLWPEDGGAFMTLPLVLTTSPNDGKPNMGMYRIQRFNDRETGIHWQIGKGGGFHYHEAEERGEALPLSLFAGGPPALILGAIAPLPEGIPELMLASLLLGGRLPVRRLKNWPHPIPAECEFAFLGHVPPKKRRGEGPFGDHYGYYSLKHPYPVFQIKKVFHRKDAIWPATVVGKPRQEDFYIGDFLQEFFSPIFPLVMPSISKLWSYGETGFHSLAAAVVKDRYAREAMMSAFRILGEGQLSLTKFLLVTDTPIDLCDFKTTLRHFLERIHWETDLFVFSNLSMDTLDYTGPEVNKGSKGVMLALGPAVRQLPGEFSGVPANNDVRDARVYCPGCLVVGGPSFDEDRSFPERIARDPAFADWPLVVVSDRPKWATASDMNFLWTTFTRFEPGADIHAREKRIVRNHIAWSGPLVIDARIKPWYPKEVFAAPAIAERVTQRWREYFPSGNVEMGSSDRAHLAPG
ncbi:MAG: 4-hydroxybenzoate decarboxylase subunit [Candidatus Sumerlaeota bacterium]|nr:4-hydroxybenzoate decarboxylase subunit [Candidatus Sumerlaeota bacterium]